MQKVLSVLAFMAAALFIGTASAAQFNTRSAAIAGVSTTYSATATSIVVTAGQGATKVPALPAIAYWWNVTDYPYPMDDPYGEVVVVTALATDTLTITRGQGGTQATAKNISGKTYDLAFATPGTILGSLNNSAGNPHTTIGDAGQQSNDYKSGGLLADKLTASTASTNLTLSPSAAAQSVQLPVGGSTSFAGVETIANIQVSASGIACTAGSTDDTLFTFSLPANSLKNVGDYVKCEWQGTGVATAETAKFWFGGTAFISDGGVTSASPIIQKMTIVKTGSNTQMVFTDDNYHGTTANIARVVPTAAAITDTAAIIIKCTANSAAATTLGNMMLIKVGHQ